MGVLFEGCDLRTQRPVAVKLLRPCFENDPERDARLLREGVLAHDLHHPHVVRVLDFGRDAADESGFIAMELLTGLSLEDELRARGSLPAVEALSLLFPVLGAVAFAHDRGVVHRDLKPSNIFLARTEGGVAAKVLDFGIAKSLAETSWHTRSGVTLGTPEYMSPEQARGEGAAATSDVWALGVVLYRTLSGRLPFTGNGSAVLNQVLHEPFVPLAKLLPDGHRHLAIAVERALARDSNIRYRDARELARGLLWGALQDRLELPLDPDPYGLSEWRSWCEQALHTADATLAAPRAARRSHPGSRARTAIAGVSIVVGVSLWEAASAGDRGAGGLQPGPAISYVGATAKAPVTPPPVSTGFPAPASARKAMAPSSPIPPAGTAVSAAIQPPGERTQGVPSRKHRARSSEAPQPSALQPLPASARTLPVLTVSVARTEPEPEASATPVARTGAEMLPW